MCPYNKDRNSILVGTQEGFRFCWKGSSGLTPVALARPQEVLGPGVPPVRSFAGRVVSKRLGTREKIDKYEN